MRAVVLPLVLAVASAGAAHADAPLPPLSLEETVCSPDRRACAHLDRRRGETTARLAGSQAVLWSMPFAPARVTISNDGLVLVAEHYGGTLLNLEDGADTPMLVIRNRGVVVRQVLLRDLVAQPDRLPRTASHRAWARYFYVDTRGDCLIETTEDRRFRIALPNGTIIEEPK